MLAIAAFAGHDGSKHVVERCMCIRCSCTLKAKGRIMRKTPLVKHLEDAVHDLQRLGDFDWHREHFGELELRTQ